jgi:phenylacetyl-CoA:acceptor oxidoreductase subunit 1
MVTIDYDLCIGCGYCAVACPYQARHIVQRARFAWNGEPAPNERARFDAGRVAVATKCTFCADRVDAGTAKGLTPGVDPEATPACVNSCIAGALVFGDRDDPASPLSKLLAEAVHFRMHEGLGTDPGMYYVYDALPAEPAKGGGEKR